MRAGMGMDGSGMHLPMAGAKPRFHQCTRKARIVSSRLGPILTSASWRLCELEWITKRLSLLRAHGAATASLPLQIHGLPWTSDRCKAAQVELHNASTSPVRAFDPVPTTIRSMPVCT